MNYECINILENDFSNSLIDENEKLNFINKEIDIKLFLEFEKSRNIKNEFEIIKLLTYMSKHQNNIIKDSVENQGLNRFSDIKIFKHNQIKSKNINYINASKIFNPFIKKESFDFIATELPNTKSTKNFWNMIIENNVKLIISLVDLEKKKNKYDYLIGNENIIVNGKKEGENTNLYEISILVIF